MSKLTQWHSGGVKPVHKGVYERDYKNTGIITALPYSKFIKGNWTIGGTIKEAAQEYFISSQQNLPWRGLANKPRRKP